VAVLSGCDAPNLLTSVHKGLIWLVVATLAAVPPTVRLAVVFAPFLLSSLFTTGVYVLEFEL
jgi:hypothetical protein